MASAGKGKSVKTASVTVEDLSLRLSALEKENKELRKKLKKEKDAGGVGADPTAPKPLTPAQKEALLTAASSRLVGLASKKICEKVRTTVGATMNRDDVEKKLKGLRLRLDLSMADVTDRAETRRSRSQSRGPSTSTKSP